MVAMRKGLVLLASLALTFVLVGTVLSQPAPYFVIYGEESCPHCRKTKELLISCFGEQCVEFREVLANETYLLQFLELSNLLKLSKELEVPLTIVYVNGVPKAAVLGGLPKEEFWRKVVERASSSPGFIAIGEAGMKELNETYVKIVGSIVGPTKQPQVPGTMGNATGGGEGAGQSSATGTTGSTVEKMKRLTVSEALPLVVFAALADSVNPCTFSVFTALLLIVAAVRGLRRSVVSGVAFVSAIYIAYFALGLGLIKALGYVPGVKYVVAALGLILGSTALIGGLEARSKGAFKSPLPASFRKLTESAIERAINPLTAALAGFVVSVTLLPCSSGPYIVTAAYLSRLDPQSMVIPLLMLYNAIFVAPLIAILAATALAVLRLRKLKEWRSKQLPLLEAVSGALLIAISLYALLALP